MDGGLAQFTFERDDCTVAPANSRC